MLLEWSFSFLFLNCLAFSKLVIPLGHLGFNELWPQVIRPLLTTFNPQFSNSIEYKKITETPFLNKTLLLSSINFSVWTYDILMLHS